METFPGVASSKASYPINSSASVEAVVTSFLECEGYIDPLAQDMYQDHITPEERVSSQSIHCYV